jgi:hypothetical protein
MQWYSFALIILGVTYKMLLTEYVLNNGNRDAIPSQYDAPSGLTTADRRQRIAHLFSGSSYCRRLGLR